MEITKDDVEFILDRLDEYHGHDLNLGDVIYTMLNPGRVLNDWDEGESSGNWDKEAGQPREFVVLKFILNDLNFHRGMGIEIKE